jgi:hypothetical protein
VVAELIGPSVSVGQSSLLHLRLAVAKSINVAREVVNAKLQPRDLSRRVVVPREVTVNDLETTAAGEADGRGSGHLDNPSPSEHPPNPVLNAPGVCAKRIAPD